jgi:hypothetical protein
MISKKDIKEAIDGLGFEKFLELVIVLGGSKRDIENRFHVLVETVSIAYKKLKGVRDECSH